MTWSPPLSRWWIAAVLFAAGLVPTGGSAAEVKSANAPAMTGDQIANWLAKGDERKRLVALEAVQWNSRHDAAYTEALVAVIDQSITRRGPTASQFRAVQVLAGSPLPAADTWLVRLLSSSDWRMQMTAADALGERGSEVAVPALMACWDSRVAVENYGLRHAIVCALGSLKGTQGIDALIRILPQLEGQLRYEAISRLTLRTGEKFGDRTEEWIAWQKSRDPNWSGPRVDQQPPPREVAWNATLPRFFRVPIYAKRVLFVVDMSGSMKSTVEGKTRLEALQDELTNAIKALPEDSLFGVIAFNDRVQPWAIQPKPATSDNKAAAIQAVWSLNAQGGTAVNDALEVALGYNGYLEQILLLTDGRPTAGKLVDTAPIVSNITGRNQFRRVRIDTIGLDTTGEAERLLQQLSEQNHGQYNKLR
ncbi:MAG TPA: VWA domain-containing protein [Planctomycetaceae bacterium]|nr:VWA domain-containing protein [Planctomycetaceae bacterium]